MKNRLVIAGLAVTWALMAALWHPAESVPAFARKYKTSCMTCHVATPKLNAFGEAFRLNGNQMPEDDLELSKDEEVKLGAEGWKRVWPGGVWPGSMPGIPPVAAWGETEFKYERRLEATRQFKRPSVYLFLAGTMHEDISIYTDLHLVVRGTLGNLARLYVQFSNLLSNWRLPRYLLNVKVGQFIPEAVPFPAHRALTLTSYAPNTYGPAEGNSLSSGHRGATRFVLERNHAGIEVRGVVKSRMRYALGLINGNATGAEDNEAKDGYFRMAYKFGGMGFDGSGGGTDAMNTMSFEDNAFTLGSFGYLGAMKNPESFGPKDLKIRRIGGDASLTYRRMNLFGVYMFGRDRSILGNTIRDLNFASWFVELDYGFYPWLIGIARYDAADAEHAPRVGRMVTNLTILARPNIKILMESVVNPDGVILDELMTRLEFAF